MIYQITASFSFRRKEYQKIFYASSYSDGYEMFKKVGCRMTFTANFIKHKMYERKQGEVRHGVFYSSFGDEDDEFKIQIAPYRGVEKVRISKPDTASDDMYFYIEYTKHGNEMATNDWRYHYGNRYPSRGGSFPPSQNKTENGKDQV